MLFRTSSESNLRPIRRLTAKTVASGLVIAWRFAICPTSPSPASVNPSIEGVVRLPSELGITTGSPPSITATQLFVVPRSIPMTLGMEKAPPDPLYLKARAVLKQMTPRARGKVQPCPPPSGFVGVLAGAGVRDLATATAAGGTSRSFALYP